MTLTRTPQPITAANFKQFGDLVEPGEQAVNINSDTCLKYPDLANLELNRQGGVATVHLYHAQPCQLPLHVTMLERHPLSSQLFMPLTSNPYLVVVATKGELINPEDVSVFICSEGQGVNYHAGTWHHPLLTLQTMSQFLVVDRKGPEKNCDELDLTEEILITNHEYTTT